MVRQSLAITIRQFLRDLFGSRLAARIDEELLRIRADYESRLRERDEIIAEQRSRIAHQQAKLDQWEMVIIPLTSPAANLLSPRRQPPPTQLLSELPKASSWSEIRAKWEQDQAAEEAQEKTNGQVS